MKIGVGVDTSMLLVIDPAYLFSEEEWADEVVSRADANGLNFPMAVLEALEAKTGMKITELAVVLETVGDGVFDVEVEDGVARIELE